MFNVNTKNVVHTQRSIARRCIYLLITAATLSVSSIVQAESLTLQERLTQADGYRLLGASTKSLVEVSQYEDAAIKQKQIYEVYAKQGKGTLVLFKSAAEAGQKMLMLDDKFWMFLPRSRRPIRITPMQKLLGDASAGDISSISWTEAYEIAEESGIVDFEGVSAVQLNLQSAVKGNTYNRIELIVSEEDNFPLKADLYLKSGKKAKTAMFEKGERDGNAAVTAMTLRDSIQKNKETVIAYRDSVPHEIANKVFNPSYLIKNNLDAL